MLLPLQNARSADASSSSYAAPRLTIGSRAGLSSTSASQAKAAKGPTVFRDENIRARRVRLVSPETNEILPGPLDTRELLASIDRKRYFLQQVSPGRLPMSKSSSNKPAVQDVRARTLRSQQGTAAATAPVDNDDTSIEPATVITLDDLPIVKLIDKKAEYDRERTAKQQRQAGGGANSKSTGSMHKDVAFTWNSTKHDVHHKLQPIRANLIKRGPGASCRVMITSKKASVVVHEEDKEAFVAEVERYLCDWQGLEQHHVDDEDQQETHPTNPAKLPYLARRRADVEWHTGKRQAMLRIEVSKK
jgi:hypothetical protein